VNVTTSQRQAVAVAQSFSIWDMAARWAPTGIRGRHIGLHGSVYPCRDVFDAHQLIQFQVPGPNLFGLGFCIEALLDVIVALVESCWTQTAPTWWLVKVRPFSETNEPEPPLLNRTEEGERGRAIPGLVRSRIWP